MTFKHIAGAGKVMLVALAALAGLAGAQTPIYRSVQPGVTAAIGTGTGTLTISGSTATFSVSQPDSIGVGDAIQYDSDSNGSIDAIAFIHGRTSGTEYTVKNAAGAAPTAVTGDEDWDIFRAYSAYASVEGGTENAGIDAVVRDFDAANRNLDTNGEIFHLACYSGTDSPLAFLWDSWDTSPTEYLEIFSPSLPSEVGTSQKHLWIYKGASGDPRSMRISSNTNIGSSGVMLDVRIRDVQIQATASTSNDGAILFTTNRSGADYRISGCLIVGGSSTIVTYGIRFESLTGTGGNGSRSIRAWNNVIKDCLSSDGGADGTALAQTGNLGVQPDAFWFDNTIINCDVGYADLFNWGLSRLINNIFQVPNTLSVATSLNPDSNYNLSEDAEAPGANSILSTTLTFAADGYHLTAADAAIAIGTDLSGNANLPFSIDIDGDTRTTWNMGADEFQAEPSVSGGDLLLRRRANR